MIKRPSPRLPRHVAFLAETVLDTNLSDRAFRVLAVVQLIPPHDWVTLETITRAATMLETTEDEITAIVNGELTLLGYLAGDDITEAGSL